MCIHVCIFLLSTRKSFLAALFHPQQIPFLLFSLGPRFKLDSVHPPIWKGKARPFLSIVNSSLGCLIYIGLLLWLREGVHGELFFNSYFLTHIFEITCFFFSSSKWWLLTVDSGIENFANLAFHRCCVFFKIYFSLFIYWWPVKKGKATTLDCL